MVNDHRRLGVSLLFLFWSATLPAQRLPIRSYTPEDGLAGAPVWRMFQDERGVLWFATDAGVSAYDGVSFHNITVENGLAGANVELIARARDGNLLFGTSEGLVRYDGRSLKTIFHDHARWAGTPDKDGNVWFGDSSGVSVFNGWSRQRYSNGLSGEEVYSVTPVGDSIWIGRRETGVVEFRRDSQNHVQVRHIGPSDGLPNPTVRAIVQDREGRMYFGTRGGGVARFDGKSFATFDVRNGLPGNDVYALLINSRGELVIGTIDKGLAICDLPDFHRCRTIGVANGLLSGSVFSLFEDREENLWIGLVNGVSKLMSLPAESYTEQEGLPSDNIYAVLPEANGDVWVGTINGLARKQANGPWKVYTVRDGLPSNEVRDIHRDRAGRLWLATARGLCTTTDPDRDFRCFSTADGLNGYYIQDIEESANGDLLVGSGGGGFTRVSYSPGKPLNTEGRLVGAGITNIAEDKRGRVWLGTSGGGIVQFEGDKVRQFGRTDGLGGDQIAALCFDRRGGLWAGIHGGRLSYLPPDGSRFRTFGKERGIDATTVAAITADSEGRLWLGTDRGVYQIDPLAADWPLKRLVLQRLDEREGLISRQVISANALRIDKAGRLWVGFLHGLTRYDPGRRVPNLLPPQAAIVSATIDGHVVPAPFTSVVRSSDELSWPIASPLHLKHKQNSLRFDFRGLSFRDERDVRFRYKLEGFDRQWSETTDLPFKEYTNLDPGSYTFLVMAANADVVWSRTPAAFGFTIQPPFWETTAFRASLIALLALLIWTGHKVRLRGVERHNRELECTVADRTEKLREHAEELEERVQKRTAELAHQALHDVLTGLPNRNLLMDRLEQAIARGKRKPDTRFAVLFLDLDRFKVVNDSLGHLTGDQLLVGTARRLEASIRPGDTVSRLGGDEFVIFLDEIATNDDVINIVERIQERLSEPFHIAGHEIYMTSSIGVTISSIGSERAEGVLRDADIAMYRAKLQGRARYELFDEWMRSNARALMELETDLRRAVERNEFRVLYQPIVALVEGRLTGFEALVRWEHPARGRTLPAEFLPLAEETGMIVAIDRWVLSEACDQLRRWQDEFPERALTMSVNLSSRQIRREDFVEMVSECMARARIRENDLGLEITEGTIMENADRAIEVLGELRARGVRWSIDDFGTGYSSLSYLHQFPVDILKIDQSFVRRVGPGAENTEIIRTIMSLARNLGMQVVAEGVETEEQLTLLRARGCDYGQGYYFAYALDAEAARELIARNPVWTSPAARAALS
jgi:diguanylate cyclase (GGDEF)-like protein